MAKVVLNTEELENILLTWIDDHLREIKGRVVALFLLMETW